MVMYFQLDWKNNIAKGKELRHPGAFYSAPSSLQLTSDDVFSSRCFASCQTEEAQEEGAAGKKRRKKKKKRAKGADEDEDVEFEEPAIYQEPPKFEVNTIFF